MSILKYLSEEACEQISKEDLIIVVNLLNQSNPILDALTKLEGKLSYYILNSPFCKVTKEHLNELSTTGHNCLYYASSLEDSELSKEICNSILRLGGNIKDLECNTKLRQEILNDYLRTLEREATYLEVVKDINHHKSLEVASLIRAKIDTLKKKKLDYNGKSKARNSWRNLQKSQHSNGLIEYPIGIDHFIELITDVPKSLLYKRNISDNAVARGSAIYGPCIFIKEYKFQMKDYKSLDPKCTNDFKEYLGISVVMYRILVYSTKNVEVFRYSEDHQIFRSCKVKLVETWPKKLHPTSKRKGGWYLFIRPELEMEDQLKVGDGNEHDDLIDREFYMLSFASNNQYVMTNPFEIFSDNKQSYKQEVFEFNPDQLLSIGYLVTFYDENEKEQKKSSVMKKNQNKNVKVITHPSLERKPSPVSSNTSFIKYQPLSTPITAADRSTKSSTDTHNPLKLKSNISKKTKRSLRKK